MNFIRNLSATVSYSLNGVDGGSITKEMNFCLFLGLTVVVCSCYEYLSGIYIDSS